MTSSARRYRRCSPSGSSGPLERAVARLRSRFPPFGERVLGWVDAVALAEALGARVELRPCREDAILLVPAGAPRVIVSQRLDLARWGVFCVAHELGHWLLHPGTRQYYLRSPGWLDKTESQANVVGLLALWPRPAPYPRVLRIDEEEWVVRLHVAFTGAGASGPAPRWRSRTLTMPRYAGERI